MAIFVGGVHCATVQFTTAQASVELGTADGLAACGIDGAEVTLMTARGSQMAESLTFALGTTAEVSNFASMPPGSRLLGYMQALLDAGWPEPPFAVEVASFDEQMAEHLRGFGSLTLFVDDTPCTVADFSSGNRRIALLGMPDQPEDCDREGGVITFLTGDGRRLVRTSVVARSPGGDFLGRDDLELAPAGTSLPAYMQAFIDGGRVSPVRPVPQIVPAGVGNGGFAATGGTSSPRWVALLTSVATASLLVAVRARGRTAR